MCQIDMQPEYHVIIKSISFRVTWWKVYKPHTTLY